MKKVMKFKKKVEMPVFCEKVGRVTEEQRKSSLVIDISQGFWTQLSATILGPVEKFGRSANILQNFWEYSKVFKSELDDAGFPKRKFYKRQKKGDNLFFYQKKTTKHEDEKVAEFFSFDEKKFSYREARHKIFIPSYVDLIRKSPVWKRLVKLFKKNEKENILIVGETGRPYTDLLEEYWSDEKSFSCELILCAILERKINSSGEWVYAKERIHKLPVQTPEYYYGKMAPFMPDEEIYQNMAHGLAKYAIERYPNKTVEQMCEKLTKILTSWIEVDEKEQDLFSDQAKKMFEKILHRGVVRAYAFLL